jgi:hypothetical protein
MISDNSLAERDALRRLIEYVVANAHSGGMPYAIIREELERAAKNIIPEDRSGPLRVLLKTPKSEPNLPSSYVFPKVSR